MRGPKGQNVHHPVPEPPRAHRRHVWVSGPPDAPGPHAGLVLDWQRRETGWFAQVAYVIEGDQAVVVQWLAAEVLSPVL